MSAQPRPQRNPFKGLRPFKQSEENELFGRDRDLILMKDRILSSRTTLLFAGSGVGKTSFLNAKVIPALSERYCVISHNQWTGAEERKNDDSWNDRPPFRVWPPKDFGKWLKEALWKRSWLHRRISKADRLAAQSTTKNGDAPPPDSETEAARRRIEAAVRSVITQNLGPCRKKRLSEELSIFKKQAAVEEQPRPCILILDQFEEVFQYHEYEDYFKNFILDLAAIINDDEYQVRIVFSMREEFLGELSAFDNHIPDLFNNYYRLRHPETDEAKHIIIKTCDLVEVNLHLDNLDNLVRDLSSIEQNFELSNQRNGSPHAPVRVVRRDFVPPPYLQIVCDSLWKEQYESSTTATDPATNGATENKIGIFLEKYKTGSDKPVDGQESDAQRAVRVFCEHNLSPPYLKKWEQRLAARAFGFLVTKQGAKMAYELRSLAAHMDEQVWAVKHVLQKLSRPEARILRESRGPQGSYWFELYHDMYASVVERWKRRFTREERRRVFIAVPLVIVAAVILPLLLYYRVKVPNDYRQTLQNYRDTLSTPDDEKDPERFAAALVAYNHLSTTFGYSGTARLLWAQIWQRRAQLYEARQQRDEALTCLLQAAALVQGRPEAREYVEQANNLFLGNEESIKATFCHDCRVAIVSPKGESLLTISNDGTVNLWNIEDHSLTSTVCSDCDQAVFSADSQNVATLGPFKQIANKPNQLAEGPQASNGWTITISAVDSGLPVVSFDVRRSQTNAVRGDEPPPRFFLKSVAKKESGGFLIVGVIDNALKVWKDDGSLFAELGVSSEAQGSYPPRADFDPKTHFLATAGFGLETKVSAVTANGLASSNISDLSSHPIYAFSSDGRYFLSTTAKDDVVLWALITQREILRIPIEPESPVFSLGFGVGSAKFFLCQRDGTIRVWNTYSDKREPMYEPLKVPRDFSKVLLDSQGKNVVLRESRGVSEWSLESRSLIGEFQVPSSQNSGALTAEGSFLGLFDSSVRLWDIPAVSRQNTFGGESEEVASYVGTSADGLSMLTVYQDPSENKPTSFRIWNLSQKTKVEFSAPAFAFSMISNPLRVLVVPNEDRTAIQVFDSEGHPQNRLTVDAPIKSITVSQNNKLIAAVTNRNDVQLIDTSTFETVGELRSKLDIGSVVFAPNGAFLLLKAAFPRVRSALQEEQADTPPESSDSTDRFRDFEVWSLSNLAPLLLSQDHSQSVDFVAFGSNRLITIQNRQLQVWDLLAAKRILVRPVTEGVVAAISLDDNLVVIGTANTLQFVDVTLLTPDRFFTLGGPIEKIIFPADGTSVVVMTESWFHNFAITNDRVRYLQAIFATNAAPDSVRVANGNVQWVLQGRGGWEVRQASFDGKLSSPFLIGDPDYLSFNWSRRLGIQITPNGYLSPNVPRRPLIVPSTL